MHRGALLHFAPNVLCAVFLVLLYLSLHALRVDFQRRGYVILDLRQRLIKAEAALVQRRRVQDSLRLPLRTETTLEGRVAQLEVEALQAHELLIGFLYSRAPPEVRHHYVYTSAQVQELSGLYQTNFLIAEHIRKNLIVPPLPAFRQTPYRPLDASRGNGEVLRHIFKNKKYGFFIECGALDGLWLSNTFYFERLLGWTGALIEADAFNFKLVLEKKRNASAIPTCLSRSTKPQLVPFNFGREAYSRIDTLNPVSVETDNVLCMPFYSILLALNRTSVDLFSLDIEGHELDVLRTIPWEDVDIKVLIVEFLNIAEGKAALERFMASKGYAIFPSSEADRAKGKWAEDDHIFVKRGIGLNEA